METALQNLGVNLADINRVFLTHLHWDHAYNLEFFPNAQFIFSDIEWEHAKRKGDHAVYWPCLDYLKDKNTRIIHADNEEILPGMSAIFIPGHTPGCIALVFDNDGETWAITGDAVKNRLELHTCIAGGNEADTLSAASIKKVKAVADMVAPGHDCILRLKDNQVIAQGGNDVTVVMPKGLLVNGQENLVLTISSNF
jgi:glyoxylase-like metal-dependent hydrolase (beta-lactamase superfamily II)